ncbi:MAG: glycosyltransferase [bacterium]|nr:glycosyltransferase [bacterium]
MNKIPEISLLLPTRNRVWALKRLFESIIKTTYDYKNIEIVLYIDEDDLQSRDITLNEITLKKITGPRQEMGKVLNTCYKESKGHCLININDDAVFETANWDILILNRIKDIQDEIYLIYGNDLHKGKKHPTFPGISRKVCEILDGFSHYGYERFLIETHLFDIFIKLRKLGYSRIFYMSDVIFEHRHYLADKSSPDETYLSRNTYKDHHLFISLARDRHYSALKLAQYICNIRNYCKNELY